MPVGLDLQASTRIVEADAIIPPQPARLGGRDGFGGESQRLAESGAKRILGNTISDSVLLNLTSDYVGTTYTPLPVSRKTGEAIPLGVGTQQQVSPKTAAEAQKDQEERVLRQRRAGPAGLHSSVFVGEDEIRPRAQPHPYAEEESEDEASDEDLEGMSRGAMQRALKLERENSRVLKTEVSELQSALEESRRLNSELTFSMDQLLARLRAEKEEEGAVRARLAASERELAELTAASVRVQEEERRVRAEAAELQAENDSLRQVLSSVRGDLETELSRSSQSRPHPPDSSELAALQHALAQVTAANQALGDELAESNRQREELQSANARLKGSLERQAEQLGRAVAQNEDLLRGVELLHHVVQDLEVVQELEGAKEGLERRVEELMRANQELRGEIKSLRLRLLQAEGREEALRLQVSDLQKTNQGILLNKEATLQELYSQNSHLQDKVAESESLAREYEDLAAAASTGGPEVTERLQTANDEIERLEQALLESRRSNTNSALLRLSHGTDLRPSFQALRSQFPPDMGHPAPSLPAVATTVAPVKPPQTPPPRPMSGASALPPDAGAAEQREASSFVASVLDAAAWGAGRGERDPDMDPKLQQYILDTLIQTWKASTCRRPHREPWDTPTPSDREESRASSPPKASPPKKSQSGRKKSRGPRQDTDDDGLTESAFLDLLRYKGLLPRVVTEGAAAAAFEEVTLRSGRQRKGSRRDPEITFDEFTDLVQRLLPPPSDGV